MNKRQRKKHKKKQEMFVVSFVSSYKELREVDRSYHEFVIASQRMQKHRPELDLDLHLF